MWDPNPAEENSFSSVPAALQSSDGVTHSSSCNTQAGEVAETKCPHKNEWENASQTPAILEKNVMVMPKISIW